MKSKPKTSQDGVPSEFLYGDTLTPMNKSMPQLIAEDLYILCRRAAYAISRGRYEDAARILEHAKPIGKRIGIEDKILREE